MFSAIILMCTIDNYCYTITNETGFFESERECKKAIYQLITREDFPQMYMYLNETDVFRFKSARCINWNDEPI
jgi:hypothetical protein